MSNMSKKEMMENIGDFILEILEKNGYHQMLVPDLVFALKHEYGYQYLTSHRFGHWMRHWNRLNPDVLVRKNKGGYGTYYTYWGLPDEEMEMEMETEGV